MRTNRRDQNDEGGGIALYVPLMKQSLNVLFSDAIVLCIEVVEVGELREVMIQKDEILNERIEIRFQNYVPWTPFNHSEISQLTKVGSYQL